VHQHYTDILCRISESPKWFDENGTPRYCAFEPSMAANIYAKECALTEISCQACNRGYVVAIDTATALRHAHDFEAKGRYFVLADIIRSHKIQYGDPPNVHCCDAGHTMNSIPRRVLEYWHRMQSTIIKNGHEVISTGSLNWERDQSLEIEIIERS
jgi:hypothetical protein